MTKPKFVLHRASYAHGSPIAPGVLLHLFEQPVAGALGDAAKGTAIAVDPLIVAILLGLLVAVIVARFLAVLRPRPAGDDDATSAVTVEGAA